MHGLVIRRRENEDVVLQVGDTTTVIRVIDWSKHGVRLLFDAPPEVRILRKELTFEEDAA